MKMKKFSGIKMKLFQKMILNLKKKFHPKYLLKIILMIMLVYLIHLKIKRFILYMALFPLI